MVTALSFCVSVGLGEALLGWIVITPKIPGLILGSTHAFFNTDLSISCLRVLNEGGIILYSEEQLVGPPFFKNETGVGPPSHWDDPALLQPIIRCL